VKDAILKLKKKDFNKIKREQTLILGIRMGDLFLHASISYQINDAKDMDVIIIYLRENGAEINVKDRDGQNFL
jgi:ankyrin repeat protein